MQLTSFKSFSGFITALKENQIFVFGSNPAGQHGAGTARIAENKYGAIYGQGRGRQGQCYGLVTKNLQAGYFEEVSQIRYQQEGYQSVSVAQIEQNIKELYAYAIANSELDFLIAYTATGQNLNGYTDKEMAHMFAVEENPNNIVFEKDFLKLVISAQVTE